MRQAFVLTLGDGTDAARQSFAGWVEHADTGRQRRFRTTDEAGSGGTRLHFRLPVSPRLHLKDALGLPEVTAFVGGLDVEQCTEREREQRYRR